jgi:GntR family transcriptional regulator
MLREQHLRKVEDALTDAINSAKIAQMSESELIETLKALYEIERSTL